MDQINFIKYQAMFNAQLTKWLDVKSFYPPLVKKTNFRRFSRKRVKFELHLPHRLLFIFYKNHFQVNKYLFGMISYCAQGCILEWQSMLIWGVFIFFGRKNHFPFSECPKGGFFVKDLPNICCKIGPNHFSKILGHI